MPSFVQNSTDLIKLIKHKDTSEDSVLDITVVKALCTNIHCVKCARIWSFSDPFFPRICTDSTILFIFAKIRVRENSRSDIFYAMVPNHEEIETTKEIFNKYAKKSIGTTIIIKSFLLQSSLPHGKALWFLFV